MSIRLRSPALVTPTSMDRSAGEHTAFNALLDHVNYSKLANAPRSPELQAFTRNMAKSMAVFGALQEE